MKYWMIVLLIIFTIVPWSYAVCPSGEYEPGPNCGLEPSCAARSSHSYPKHTCDCWCLPGTYRRLDLGTCVTISGCNG